jgi:hypothetical protein
VIESDAGAPTVSATAIKVLVSEDNRIYYPYNGSLSIETVTVNETQKVAMHFDNSTFRYLKLVPALGGHRRFTAPMNRLLQAYE